MFRREPSNSVPLRHRWLRFSLRTLLVVVTVFGVWLGVKVDQARRQKEAVEALKQAGAWFYYAHQRYDAAPDTFDPSKQLVVPEWLGPAGPDLFQSVVSVQGLRTVSDKDLSQLAALPHIEHLYIGDSESYVTDVGLAHLPRPDRLIRFGAPHTFVGDGFMKRLRNARRIESLKNAKRLRHLGLSRTSVSDAGLRHLHGLPELRSVTLDNTPVTADGIAALRAATPALRAVNEEDASQLRSAEARAEEAAKMRKLFAPRRAAPLPRFQLPAQNKADAQAP